MIENFINQYQVSKTLQFSLIPQGNTEYFIQDRQLIEEDSRRAGDYKRAKELIDEYHKSFIARVLESQPCFVDVIPENAKDKDKAESPYRKLERYAELYRKNNKTDSDKDDIKKLAGELRECIVNLFKNGEYKEEFAKLKSNEKIVGLVSENVVNEDDKKIIESFSKFTTYFKGFTENRENMYTAEGKATEISNRCIGDNLPKFLFNEDSYNKIRDTLPPEKMEEIINACGDISLGNLFSLTGFDFVLSQGGIDEYNRVVGIINRIINEYNQQNKDARLPKLKVLYKQILSDRAENYFDSLEPFGNDNELIKAVNKCYVDEIAPVLDGLTDIFGRFTSYDLNHIFIKSGLDVTDVSNKVFGYWGAVEEGWSREYDDAHTERQRKSSKYEESKKKDYKKREFSITAIQNYGSDYLSSAESAPKFDSVAEYFRVVVTDAVDKIKAEYCAAEALLTNDYPADKSLKKSDNDIELIKNYLEAVKTLERLLKQLCGGEEYDRCDEFYSDFDKYLRKITELDRLYDKVRNYITQKPFSQDKFKLNFRNPQFLDGWDKNKEKDYLSVLLRKGNYYYLGIMENSCKDIFENPPYDSSDTCYEKMVYKLLPGPNKMLPKVFFSAKGIEAYRPSEHILSIYKSESFKKGDNFNISGCHDLIDFYKSAIARNHDWDIFEFKYRDTQDYNDIGEFYNDVANQGYKVTFTDISSDYIDSLVAEGKLYLFRIYCKDFSEHSHGTPNIHTLYFRMLFDERNLNDVVYKLNGEAEMFYRKPSLKIENTTVHKANEPIDNKNEETKKKKPQSTFEYDLIKDRRYTEAQYSIHIPITMNFKAKGNNQLNTEIRQALKDSDNIHIIGIDRGERNLIYVSVIDGKGEILEQYSLNDIVNEYKGIEYRTDYSELLAKKEKDRQEERRNWETIENIKELKEGYISQVVHKICELVVKYDAVIALEDLNGGFKNSRKKVERQVYQKFEKMLIDKLNYLVPDKKSDPDSIGGLLHAYQLTEKFESFEKMTRQNGIIFYIPAWNTSKIDPVTGFVDMLKPKYESEEKSIKFIEKIDDIVYNAAENMYEFHIDMRKFPKCQAFSKNEWIVYTNGKRIRTFRNPEKNSEWDSKEITLTDEFDKLFEEYGISKSASVKEQILLIKSKDFFERFMKLLSLTLQMRNSVSGTDIDYLISPVKDEIYGRFYNSDDYKNTENPRSASLPIDADANGAYNIARKVLLLVNTFKESEDDKLDKIDTNKALTNKDWLDYTQNINS